MMARRPSAFKQRDLARAVKGIRAAGVEVSAVKIDKDGAIVLSVNSGNADQSDQQERGNPWHE